MALIPTDRLPKAQTGSILESQKKAQESVQTDPFKSLNLGKIKVEADPNYAQQQNPYGSVQQPQARPVQNKPVQQPKMVRQPQARPVPSTPVQNGRPQAHLTANGRMIKTSVNGNTYPYEDKFDHSRDVMLEQDAKFLLRLPKEHKDYLERLAKAERTSLNQMIVRAINQYVGSNRR